MEKRIGMFALVLVFGLGLFGSYAFGANPQPQGQVPVYHPPAPFTQGTSGGAPGEGGTMCGYFSPAAWDTAEASWLLGSSVSSPVGGNLGQISDFMIDRTDGHIALVILSGIPGLGTEFVAAPFSALERTGESVFQLSFGDREVSITETYTDPYAYELERSKSTVGLSTIPESIDSRWVAGVYRFYGRTPYWNEEREPQIMSYRTAAEKLSIAALFRKEGAPVLMGSMVQSSDGKATGRIEDMVIDMKDGLAVLLVLDRVPGKGDTMVAVPFGELSLNGNTLVLNTTESKVAAAPTFNEETDLHSVQWAETDYQFFGVQPCWSEEGMSHQ